MQLKWRIYLITLLTYAVVHSLRTMWSAIKSNLTSPPFNYKVTFLGTLDMVILFVIAIFMNFLGPKIQIIGVKKCLLITMIGQLIFNTLIGIFLNLDFTQQWLYVIFFGFGVGIASSLAWPSCLYVREDQNRCGITLSAWNGTSQLGDFISLITFFAVVQTNQWQPQASFFLGSAYILVTLCLIIFLIPKQIVSEIKPDCLSKVVQEQAVELQEDQVYEQEKQNPCALDEKNKQDEVIVDDKKIDCQSEESEGPSIKESNMSENKIEKNEYGRVNMITVWKLPGVALNVLSYGFIKSVNAFIISWMVYYLISLEMGSEALLVTILWSVAVFLGGIICGIINKKLKRIFFVFELISASVAFILLESFHMKIYETQIIIGIIICALFYGGPYSLMSTAIPILLGDQEEVKKYENGKSAIISLVQGFGLFFCGISLLLMPALGVGNINLISAGYCLIAAFLLLGQMYRTRASEPDIQKDEIEIIK